MYHTRIVAANDEHDPMELDEYCERPLSYLLYAWTYKDVVTLTDRDFLVEPL
jgi:hypothetical protein